MANLPYTALLNRFWQAGIDWEADSFLLVVIGTTDPSPAKGYTFNADHATRAAVEAASDLVIDNTIELDGMDLLTAGRVTADNILTLTPGLGERVTNLVLCTDTNNSATDVPILHWDENTDGSPISRDGDGSVAPILWSPSLGMAKAGR